MNQHDARPNWIVESDRPLSAAEVEVFADRFREAMASGRPPTILAPTQSCRPRRALLLGLAALLAVQLVGGAFVAWLEWTQQLDHVGAIALAVTTAIGVSGAVATFAATGGFRRR